MSLFKSKPLPDVEIDIENLPVSCIDRRGKYTLVAFSTKDRDEWLLCSIEKHNEFIRRFRRKLKLI